ncbi:MAG: hypothetical protein PHR18_02305 [Oscillospiraceae bacterium]|nr:hypothetical protein [Oscillospiraceae bacterium]
MVTSKNPFQRLPAQFLPDCGNPPRNAETPADDNNAVWRKTDRKDVLFFT